MSIKIKKLNNTIIKCNKCPRLINFIKKIKTEKRRQNINEKYWGKPVPGFGDVDAKLLIVGLAPAAHGGTRTGRAFTGDKSGDFLFKTLFQTEISNKSIILLLSAGILNGIAVSLYSYKLENLKIPVSVFIVVVSVFMVVMAPTLDLFINGIKLTRNQIIGFGLAALSIIFLNKYQVLFIIVGVLSNLIGINWMLQIIQKHELYRKDRGSLKILMQINMKKSFYFTLGFSFVVFFITIILIGGKNV